MRESIESSVLAGLKNGETGAEYCALETLSKFVLDGIDPSPKFQKVANLIIARSMLKNQLPPKKGGRPKGRNGINGQVVAARYAELMDGGFSYEHAVSKLALDYHKDERHIMRIVAANKDIVAAKKYIGSIPEIFQGHEVGMLASELVRLMNEIEAAQDKQTDPQSDLDGERDLIERLDKEILGLASGDVQLT